jgi:SnoaL-like domain
VTADPQEFFSRWLTAINDLDWDVLETMVDPECILDFPQSGERIRGFENWRRHTESYPGGLSPDSAETAGARLIAEPERWAISPGYTVVRMSNPDRFTTTVKSAYPDGTHWWIITAVEMRDERVYRLTSFFAPEIEAPLMAHIGTATRD